MAQPSEKKRYPNPDRPGAYLKLTPETAKRLGITDAPLPSRTAGRVSGDVTNEAPPVGPVTSSTAPAPEPEVEIPAGAIPAGGPTARARSKAQAEADAPQPGDTEPAAEPMAEPKDKKRPAPSRRRRAAPATKEG